MANTSTTSLTRRGLLGVFAATAVIAAPSYSNAFGLLKGAGDIRRVRHQRIAVDSAGKTIEIGPNRNG